MKLIEYWTAPAPELPGDGLDYAVMSRGLAWELCDCGIAAGTRISYTHGDHGHGVFCPVSRWLEANR